MMVVCDLSASILIEMLMFVVKLLLYEIFV